MREWIAKFKAGHEELGDQARSGRPREVDREEVLAAIEETPSLTTRMLADDFDCGKSTIARILHELGKTWKKTLWIPHELTGPQMQNRLNVAESLLTRHNRAPFLEQLITADDKWVSFNNPDPRHEWRAPGEKTSGTPKKDFRHKKAILSVFWSVRGIEHWELLEPGQKVNSEIYCRQLDELKQKLGRRRKSVVFLDDNASCHTSELTTAKLRRFGWERLDHPSYSPDLAPSDYHLFRSLQSFLRGKKFDNVDKARESLREFFDSKDADFYRRGIEKLPERWQEVIDFDGDYFD